MIEYDYKLIAKHITLAAEMMNLSDHDLSFILGMDYGSTMGFSTGRHPRDYDPTRALLLIQVYYALFNITGLDASYMQVWVRNHNIALGDTPLNLMNSEEGLKQVVGYLESRMSSGGV